MPYTINMAFSFRNENEVIVSCSGRIRYEVIHLTCSQLDLLLQRGKTPHARQHDSVHQGAETVELDQHGAGCSSSAISSRL